MELLQTLDRGQAQNGDFQPIYPDAADHARRFRADGHSVLPISMAPAKNRLEVVKEFNEDQKIPVFLVSLKAGGTGLNLVGADTVIHYDMWWNPAVENQATDRVHRLGQKNSVSAYKLITLNTIEEKIVEMQKTEKRIGQESGKLR